MKDPGSFTILVRIGEGDVRRVLRDLGASINLMPLSVFSQLGLGYPRPTIVMLQLADMSIVHHEGGDRCLKAFEELKKRLVTTPIIIALD